MNRPLTASIRISGITGTPRPSSKSLNSSNRPDPRVVFEEATERLQRVANRGLKVQVRSGVPCISLGKLRLEGDAGTLVAVFSRHELAIIRRLSGAPGVLGKPQRVGESVHVPVRPDAVPLLTELGKLQ